MTTHIRRGASIETIRTVLGMVLVSPSAEQIEALAQDSLRRRDADTTLSDVDAMLVAIREQESRS